MDNKAEFDVIADKYDEVLESTIGKYGGNISYYSEHKIVLMRKYLKLNGKKILEFGCGSGRNIKHIQKYFPESEVCGCDLSRKSLMIARRDNPGVKFYEIQDLLAQNRSYDVILIAGVLHHIAPSERGHIFSQINSLLIEAGRIMVFEHNPLNPFTLRIVRECPFDKGVTLIKPREMRLRFAQAGFKSEYLRYCFLFPAGLRIFSPLERLVSPIPLGAQYFMIGQKI